MRPPARSLEQTTLGPYRIVSKIGELDLAVQPKLLHALENREVTPVGANAPIEIDVGIVCASHRELRTEVATRRFRERAHRSPARIARSSIA